MNFTSNSLNFGGVKMKSNRTEIDSTLFKIPFSSLYSDHNPVISVIIPSFNEEKSLVEVLRRTHSVLNKIGLSYEIIVVNDGSTDRTSKVVLEGKSLLVENPQNLGKGASMKRGLKRANGEFIVFMDADGEHSPEDIPLLLYPFLYDKQLSVVFGSRFFSKIEGEVRSRLHLMGNKLFNLIIYILTGKLVTDSLSGFRVFRSPVLKCISIDSSNFDVEAEILLKVLKNGFEFKEVPITFNPRIQGSSKVRPFRDGLNILKAILKYSFTRA